jgi:hypothetical protein
VDLLFLISYAAFWFLTGMLLGAYVVPWLVDRWRG